MQAVRALAHLPNKQVLDKELYNLNLGENSDPPLAGSPLREPTAKAIKQLIAINWKPPS